MTAPPRIRARGKIARIATASARGTPQIMPLWWVSAPGGRIRMTNGATSPTVRNIAHDARVTVLIEDERDGARRVLRIEGTARYRPGRRVLLATLLRQLAKYHLAPRALAGAVRHPRRVPAMLRYYVERSDSGVIEVTPASVEIVELG